MDIGWISRSRIRKNSDLNDSFWNATRADTFGIRPHFYGLHEARIVRRLQSKPKDSRKVSIPHELRDSLLDVFELIQQAKNDPDINLDYDDAIQVGAVCGGRYGKKPRVYVLTYFPQGDAERGRWFLTFDLTEIEDINDGHLTELMLHCCTSSDCRCKFREPDDHCFHCDYAEDPNYGTFAFPDAAFKLSERGIARLSEDSAKEDVVSELGAPDGFGGGIEIPPLGYVWPWIIYHRPDCQLRFEFNQDSTRIRCITVMEKDWGPGT